MPGITSSIGIDRNGPRLAFIAQLAHGTDLKQIHTYLHAKWHPRNSRTYDCLLRVGDYSG